MAVIKDLIEPRLSYSNQYVVRRAERYICQNYGEYHAANNNCQHFATEVKTGIKWSDQSIRAYIFTAGIGRFK